jgi:hypothetical protein
MSLPERIAIGRSGDVALQERFADRARGLERLAVGDLAPVPALVALREKHPIRRHRSPMLQPLGDFR